MIEPFDHGVGSASAVIGRNTAGGMMLGIAVLGLGFGFLGAGLAALVGHVIGFSWVAVMTAGLVSGVVGALGTATTGAKIGSILGFSKGLYQASSEEAAFNYARGYGQERPPSYIKDLQSNPMQLVDKIDAAPSHAAVQEIVTKAFAEREVARREAAQGVTGKTA